VSESRAFIFAGGGSGGHLYPALAIAEHLAELAPDRARSHFVCGSKELDRSILEPEGASYTPIEAAPFAVRPAALARFLRSWGPSTSQASHAIERVLADSGPERIRVVAMGGYVAAPMVRAAGRAGLPVTLVNLDARPGRANRWIARHADQIVSASPTAARWTHVGPIVRRRALARGPREHARLRLGLEPLRPTLLVTGASQGAASINDLMTIVLDRRPDVLHGWQVIHQTGREGEADVARAYDRAGVRALVGAFFRNMGELWGSADLAVSRGGAGSVAEAWANRVPAIFMPYPHHRDEHQKLNAAPLVDAGGAIVVRDRIDAERNLALAGEVLAGLLVDQERRDQMRHAFEAMGPVDGARRVATLLIES